MTGPGGVITNAAKGSLGIVLNAREIARTANGDILTEFEATEIQPRGGNGSGTGAYGGIEGKRTRLVDASNLTAAQARDGGISTAQYQEARDAATQNSAGGVNDSAKSPAEMNDAERAEVSRLQARDSAVKQEEKGHAAAAGQYASAPQYQYAIGPDGKAYAVGGHVDVAISTHGGSASDTKQALSALQSAALSPNAPSGADMAAFRQASMLMGIANQKHTQASPVADLAENSAKNTSANKQDNHDLQFSGSASTADANIPATDQTRNAADAYATANRYLTANENESPSASNASPFMGTENQRGSFFNLGA
ncbi:putative metalloprotease CJM1_0395 family protein [Thalassospira mesophila]|uniref:putative metalloprotease CJM1_0395 family protein n=1 Tax=Thalassospira mesophila TaxID=1293891 RepID=UPI000A1F5084|nr:putative metalloprotease CJM1_0395 family protein [Thalassospira mesophila]